MSQFWASDPCYEKDHGVNGTICSFIVYLSEASFVLALCFVACAFGFVLFTVLVFTRLVCHHVNKKKWRIFHENSI